MRFPRVSKDDIEKARLACPVPLWERWGFSCVASGGEYRIRDSAGNTLYRSFRNSEGVWLSVNKDCSFIDGEKTLNNIDLCAVFERAYMDATGKRLYALSFANIISLVDSVCHGFDEERKADVSAHQPDQSAARQDRLFFRLSYPPSRIAALEGREYLERERRISRSVISRFEKGGVLGYLESGDAHQAAVVFKGWKHDEGGNPKLAFAAKRLIRKRLSGDPSEKYNLPGSDRKYIPMLAGTGPMIMVEGGVDMLSVATMFEACGRGIPSVVMFGGRTNMKVLENERFIGMAKRADENIYCISDNDKFASLRERNQAERMLSDFRKAMGASGMERIKFVNPPDGFKDANDFLVRAGMERIRDFVGNMGRYARPAANAGWVFQM